MTYPPSQKTTFCFIDRQVHHPFPLLAYIGPVLNMSDILEIQRGHFLNDRGSLFSHPYEPPPLELYTYFSRAEYFWIFLSLHFFQIVIIYFIKQCWIKSSSSLWKTFLTSAVQSHFPFPAEDWDAKYGGCIDHIKRKIEAQKEFLVITLVNLFFNLIHLFPLVILCKCYNNIPYALWQ